MTTTDASLDQGAKAPSLDATYLDLSAGAGLDDQSTTSEVMKKAARENFTVASRLVPRMVRENLQSIYAYARFIDDIGDLVAGDREAQLDWAEQELDRALLGKATHPIFVRCAEMASALDIDRGLFIDLISANRQDQVVKNYETFEDLVAYCALSANPVGRMVLAVFGVSGPSYEALSDDVCTGLQIVEHLQDVAEDFAAGRIYLPREDMERFGVTESMLRGDARVSGANPGVLVNQVAGRDRAGGAREVLAPRALRRLIAFESGRARCLLSNGTQLVSLLSGAARVAVAGFVGGGLAQLLAIEKASYDVVHLEAKATKVAVALETAKVLMRAQSRAGLLQARRWLE